MASDDTGTHSRAHCNPGPGALLELLYATVFLIRRVDIAIPVYRNALGKVDLAIARAR